MTVELLNQYTEICRVAIKSSSAKLGKTFENLLLEIILLYVEVYKRQVLDRRQAWEEIGFHGRKHQTRIRWV